MADVAVLILIAGIGAVLVAALSVEILQRTLGLTTTLDRNTFLLIILGGFAFAAIGSLYPLIKGVRMSPVEAMKSNQGVSNEIISIFTFSKSAQKAGVERARFRHSRKSGNPGKWQKQTGCPPARA